MKAAAVIATAVIVLAPAAIAARAAQTPEDPHRAAALAFYEASKVEEPEAVGRMVASMIAQLQPGLARHEDILAEFARDLVTSDRYRDMQIGILMDLFTERELESLAQIFSTRVFRKYRRSRVAMARRSAEEIIRLFRDELPELERRIRERAGASSGTPRN